MKILLVGEGKHELGTVERPGALRTLVERLFPREIRITCRKISDRRIKRVHRLPGQGRGQEKVVYRWCQVTRSERFDALILLVDRDGQGSVRSN